MHATLDLLIGTFTFSVIITLLALSVALLITFPLAIPFVWLLFVCAKGIGIMERSRVSALLDLHLSLIHI